MEVPAFILIKRRGSAIKANGRKGEKRKKGVFGFDRRKKRRRNSFESVAFKGKTVDFKEIFRRPKGREERREKENPASVSAAALRKNDSKRGASSVFGNCKTKNLLRADQSLSLRQAMPGSTLPSNSSREAPPPVEMCVILSAKPSCCTAAALSPPPMMVVALPYASARA